MVAKMEDREWLQTLQPGGKVAVGQYGAYEAKTVERITPTQILVPCTETYSIRFNCERGHEIGNPYGQRLAELTSEIASEITRRYQVAYLERVKWNGLSPVLVSAVYDMVKEGGKGSGENNDFYFGRSD